MPEAVQVLKDSKHFTVDASQVDAPSFFRHGTAQQPGFLGRSMIAVDEPDHMRLRGLVSKAFTPKYIAGLRPSIQQIADDLLDRVEQQGQMDLVHDYGYPLPINVISAMLGVPDKNREQIRRWSEALSGMQLGPNEERRNRVREFTQYIGDLVGEKRKHPQDDLISQLVQIEEGGDKLDEAELLSMVGLLIFAGHETTSNLISIGTLVLFDNPEQLARLKADASLVPSAVEELLRINGPVLMPAPRFVTEDIELGGAQLQRTDLILVALGSANRDESQFSSAEDLEVARTLNRHIAFGQGIHICLGAPLARLEGEIAFATLLRRLPNLRMNVPREEVAWRGGMNLRGLRSLPVAF